MKQTSNKQAIKGQVRQGDVLVNPAGPLHDKGQDGRENGRIILAHGEVTGHAHEVAAAPEEARFLEWKEGHDSLLGTRLLEVLVPEVPLTHQEHSLIPLKQGAYEVIRQIEYHPESIRNVGD